MHGISRLSLLIRNPIARRSLVLVLPAALVACGVSPPGGSTESVRKVGEVAAEILDSQPEEEAAAEPPKDELQATKEVLVLVIENQERCLDIAYGAIANFQSQSSAYNAHANVVQYLTREARPEIEISERTMKVINRLLPEAQAGLSSDIANPLMDMYHEMERLCNNAKQAGNALLLDPLITEEIRAFSSAKARIAEYIRINKAEQRQILMAYGSEIYGSRAVVARSGDGGDSDDILSGDNTISAAERERKQEAWADYLAEQKRIEQEKKKRKAARQAAMEQRRQEQSRDTGPMVGLNPTGEAKKQELQASSVDRTLVDNMIAWHRVYAAKVVPVKQALGRYYQLDPQLRGPREIRACQKLVQVIETLMADRTALSSPDPEVTQALKTAFTQFHQAGAACINGQAEARASSMTAGEKALSTAAVALRPYGLAP